MHAAEHDGVHISPTYARATMQGAAAAIPRYQQGCILQRCVQLARLEAILLHLLAADERSALPGPPLSANSSSVNASSVATTRRNVADWTGGEPGNDEDGTEETTVMKLGRGQQRALKACQCAASP